jgi:hypothetical protein
MPRSHVFALIAVGGLTLAAQPATAFADRDCSNFPSWRGAQHYFHKHGGLRGIPLASTPITTASPTRI